MTEPFFCTARAPLVFFVQLRAIDGIGFTVRGIQRVLSPMHRNIQATVANAQATRSVFVALGQGRSGDAFDNFGIFKIINFYVFETIKNFLKF